jgi:hypothetical protein
MSREQFVEAAPSRSQLLPVQQIVAGFAQRIRELHAADAFEADGLLECGGNIGVLK